MQADIGLAARLESILLVAGGPVSVSQLARAVEQPESAVRAALAALADALVMGTRLQFHENQAQLVSAPEHIEDVHRFLGTARPPGLSRAALETLTVVAYRQPVTRNEIEAIRGVNSDRAVQTLLARGLIEERGKRDAAGHPMEYGTSFGFLEYFGLRSIDELPPLHDDAPAEVDGAIVGLSAYTGPGATDE